MKKFIVGLLIVIMIATLAAFVAAQTDHVVISEVMYNPADSLESGKEWIELYNPTDHAVNISYWTIMKKDDNVFLPEKFLA